MSGESRQRAQLTATQMRDLIKDYGIIFRGPLTPSQWPSSYSKLFGVIREIARIEYDEYNPNKFNDKRSINELKRRAEDMVETAQKMRRELANESSERAATEPHVFKRLDAKFKCKICRDYLWLSEFWALPSDEVEAEELSERQAARTLCNCSDDVRAANKPIAAGETDLFMSASERLIKYDPKENLLSRGVPKRKPDRVFGLARTKSLKQFSMSNLFSDLRQSPYSDGDILYPFLITEAKAERGSGFEAIETQAAFPIRACLKLQEDLRQYGRAPFHPLVWFASNQGDEWRIAACVLEGSEYQIIDLWMGRTTSLDGALQLLRIIDFICNWARDVFRFDILKCLAGDRDLLRHASPYSSRFSHREGTLGSPVQMVQDAATNNRFNIDSDIEIIDLTGTETIGGDPSDVSGDATTVLPVAQQAEESPPFTHPLLEWANTSHQISRYGTIWHSNLCWFTFTHLSLPEECDDLAACLDKVGRLRFESIQDIANDLISVFRDNSSAMLTTSSRIHQLQKEWLKKIPDALDTSETPVRALFNFRTYIRKSDWQIEREMSCISCTLKSLKAMAAIAGVNFEVLGARDWWSADQRSFSSSDIHSIRHLTGNDSIRAALNSIELYLVKGWTGYQWVVRNASDIMSKSFLLLSPQVFGHGTLKPFVVKETDPMEVFPKRIPDAVRNSLGPSLSSSQTEILLSKGSDWPELDQKWCLMVLDDEEFKDPKEIGRRLARARLRRELYIVNLTEGGERVVRFTQPQYEHSTAGTLLDMWITQLST